MYASLWRDDSREDAVKIFTGFLGVAHALRFVKFQGFKHVTRLPFIRYGNRDDVQIGQSFDFIATLAHTKHLDDALVCGVITIFRASIALCYPHTLLLLGNGVADIF